MSSTIRPDSIAFHGLRRFTLLFILMGAALGVDAYLSYRSVQAINRSRELVRHTNEVLLETQKLMTSVSHVILRQRRYIITGEENLLATFKESGRLANVAMDTLGEMTKDNPYERRKIEDLKQCFHEVLAMAKSEMDLYRSQGTDAVRPILLQGGVAMKMGDVNRILQEIMGEEKRLLDDRERQTDRDIMTAVVTFTAAVAGILLLMAWVHFLLRREFQQSEMNRHILERKVAERTVQLEGINKELEAFCYSVSHDLRAPLRSISGFSEAVMEDCHDQLSDTGKDYLNRIVAAGLRMSDLIDDLLNLSRVTRGDLTRERIDLSDMAGRITAELTRNLAGRKIDIQIEEGLVAEADPRLMAIALTNLLDNALKYSGRQLESRIEFRHAAETDGAPTFVIRDNGVGFDMDHAERIFTPFHRLHASVDFSGSGIGLAIVQRIIARHGGRIWAEAKENEGAAFHFTLQT